ncbi:MAG: hypothetical protein HOD92_06270 [Deltaproteobacteria bacterium]|jgi:hypothetical protein|nr:hypothetical protein [Deltaproteobacteria bacterium]
MRISNRKNNLIFFQSLLWLIFFLVFTSNVLALGFKNQLSPGLELRYKHWNEKKQKITGYTNIKHKIVDQEIIISSENINQKGEVYSKKELWFKASKGQLKRSEESDYRNGLLVIDIFSEKNIKTYVKQKSEEKTFDIELTEQLVPFEVIDMALQKRIPEIIKNKKIELVLYLPLIAFELDANHLPISLSELEIVAKLEKIKTCNSILGEKKCVWISVKPTSFLVKTLLPSEKTTFSFIFLAESPGYLVEFYQGNVKLQLESVNWD